LPTPLIVYPDADPGIDVIFASDLGQRLERLGRFVIHHGAPADEAEFIARIAGAEAVVLGWGMPDSVLEEARGLKVIAFTGIGAANHVNLDLAKRLGVAVCNTPGYADQTVAEHTMALMLAVARRITELDADTRAGGWSRDLEGFDLNGRRLGLIGLGGIGTRVAGLARAFGMQVTAWTAHPSPERAAAAGVAFAPLETVLGESDVVSLHLALTPETRGLLTADRLALLRPGAVLVNTARGELVDEEALLAALESGRIRAGLDVFHQEPLAPNHPLRGMRNVVLTPHTGYNTPSARRAIYELAVQAVEGYFAGRPINVVNR
jgi:D-3-phosphoglycerate dehydrogenase